MGIKNARKVVTKKRTYASGSGSSVDMAEMPPHGANNVQPPPPPPLPPGVYFSPSREECLGLLNRSIAGDKELRDARGFIVDGNIYGESPDALCRGHPRASIRECDHTWWFLSQTRFKSQTAGGGTSRRADRHVGTDGYWRGYWRLEQSKEKLDDDGFKNTFGFYIGQDRRKDKTAWLMQEFTSTNDDGAGKQGVPALYRVYVTPRATDEQLRDVFGEDGVKHGPDGTKKPARIMVPGKYFHGIAALLPPGSVRGGVGQEHVQAPQPPPLVDFYSQQEHYLGKYHQQQQQGQVPPLPPVAPEGLPDDFYSQQLQYQYQCQQEQEHQEPLSVIAPPLPPPASPGLLAELAANAPSEILSMPMAEFLSMLNYNEQPGEEPNWKSLEDILDDDELANFNKEG